MTLTCLQKRTYLFAFFLCFSIIFIAPTHAAETLDTKQPPKQEAKQPVIQESSKSASPRPATPVNIERSGTDTLGAALSLQLQDIFNKGTLCNLTAKDEPQIRIILATRPEFDTRPQVGSAYAVVWLFYQGPSSFNAYLASEVGVVTPENVMAIATALAEKTVGIAAQHAYLFENK